MQKLNAALADLQSWPKEWNQYVKECENRESLKFGAAPAAQAVLPLPGK